MSYSDTTCPGYYCGRTLLPDGKLSDCGACPRGSRRNDTNFLCEPCLDTPTFYDWFYLGFNVLLVLVLHLSFIDMVIMRRRFNKAIIILHTTAILEVIISGIVSLLLMHPQGEFKINICKVRNLADWYTLWQNPSPNYEKQIYCTQEAVYPLYTIVFVFHVCALFSMLLIRPWICRIYYPMQSKMSVYAAMYFIPILMVVHALIGGLLYYSFPYLIVILSVISCASHFAKKLDQSAASLMITTVLVPRNMIIVIGHWIMHAYGIISITQLTNPTDHALLILLIPVPTLFYICTAKFTDPSKFHV
nr:JNK1/MAPK8-associated membrane protein isoform X1 [Onthophagus taurus]XP_022904524.1 JNK1/MAPK8-associated membrane protein isoform X1 [Onthophagus taurus]